MLQLHYMQHMPIAQPMYYQSWAVTHTGGRPYRRAPYVSPIQEGALRATLLLSLTGGVCPSPPYLRCWIPAIPPTVQSSNLAHRLAPLAPAW